MAYTPPAVLVFQQFVSQSPVLSPPDLDVLLVGPNYQVLDKEPVLNVTYDPSLGNTIAGYPSLETGAVVDLASNVDVYFKDVVATIVATSTAGAVTADGNVLTDAGNTFITKGVSTEDRIKLINPTTSLEELYIVDSVLSETTIKVFGKFEYTGSLISYRIVNDIKDYTEVKIRNPIDNVDPNTDFAVSATQITLDAGIKVYATGGQDYPVESVGSISITYRALRTQNSAEILDVESLDEIQGKLGVIDIRNPLAVAANIAIQNTISRVRTFSIDEDNSQGYLEVLDRIEDTDEVYALVQLTQDATVAAAYKSHVDSLSLPEKGRWRRMFWSPSLIKEKTVQQLSGTGDFEYVDSATALTMEDLTNGTFITSNVVVGDYIRVKDEDTQGNPQTHKGVYKVTEVISEQKIKFENVTYTGTAGSGSYTAGAAYSSDFLDVSIDYELFRILDKTGMADAMASLAESYKDSRVHQVLSDQIEITLSDGDHTVPGYYLCAAIGGMVAGAPPHQGFTNLGIAGIKKLYNSNKYFNETQLNKMAEKGVYIVVQDVLGSLPYTRHQMSTDTTILERQELSIGKTVDYISYFFKRRLKSVLGVYNITPSTLALVSTMCNAIIVYLQENTLPKIGAPLLKTSEIVSVTQSETFKDQINAVIDIDVPFPVNKIRVDLLI